MAFVEILHPSDEMYGADRVLVQLVSALAHATPVVRLPGDLPYAHQLCAQLQALQATRVIHEGDLPVLRRAYMRPRGLLELAGRARRWAPCLPEGPPRARIANTAAVLPAAALASARDHAPLHLYLHEALRPHDLRILMPFLSRCAGIIAVSGAITTVLPAKVRRRTTVVYNGFPDVVLQERSRPPGELRILIASRWNSWKGHGLLLQAWELHKRTGGEGRLRILGGPPLLGEATEVRALASDAVDVELVGEVDDVSPHLAWCDVVVVPSLLSDPLPTIALEAWRAERPVAATPGGGIEEVVDKHSGWVVAPTVAAWAEWLGGVTVEACTVKRRSSRALYERLFTVEAYAHNVRRALSL